MYTLTKEFQILWDIEEEINPIYDTRPSTNKLPEFVYKFLY
jgi:hypothetical protein